jgi:hypothetical protein
MHCPYKHCESTDILQLSVSEGARLISNFYGTEHTTYCKCLACGKYFKYVSFCAPLGSTEKREAMAAEIKAMAALRTSEMTSARSQLIAQRF